MAWPAYFPLASGTDIQSNHPTDDIETAGLERYYGANGGVMGALPFVGNHHALGDDIQDVTTYADAQARTRGNRASFIDPTVGYSGTGKPADGAWGFTDADFAAASTLNVDGFDATYPREIIDVSNTTFVDGDTPSVGDKALHADGLVYQWGGAAPWTLLGCCGPHKPDRNTVHRDVISGDYLTETPDLFNQIKLAADVLIWTKTGTTAFTGLSIVGDGEEGLGGAANETSYANVTAAITAAFGLNPFVSTGGIIQSFADLRQAEPGGPSVWGGLAQTDRSKYLTAVSDTHFAYTGEFYFFAQARTIGGAVPVFDAQGTAAIDTDWVLADTQGPTTGDKTSVFIGPNPNIPDVPAFPPAVDFVPGVDKEETFGFFSGTGQQTAILKWNVAAGFTMVQ